MMTGSEIDGSRGFKSSLLHQPVRCFRIPSLSLKDADMKPVALIADAIMDCTSRRDIVLDGFLGSGTTVIAAERTGRGCYGMELDPLYVDVIVRRWQDFTRFEVRQVLHGTLGAFAGELKPIVLVNPHGALGLDAARANQTQAFDQLWKIACRGRISGLPQPRQRALSAPDADLEQLIQ
jgi:DNA methylase